MAANVSTITIVGAGAWGTALAQSIALGGGVPLLWTRDPAQARLMRETRTNPRYLEGVELRPEIAVTSEAADLAAADVMLLAVPVQTMREVLGDHSFTAPVIVSCGKGLERRSGQRPTEVIRACRAGVEAAALSGPSFAGEVARGQPTGLSLASDSLATARRLASTLGHAHLRLYPSDDLIGVELGGALKNVLAIAAGVVMGMDLGENARATLICRGLAEITRLAVAEGARVETLMGLAGLGDILLTATSLTSRNTRLGFDLARHRRTSNDLAEGRHTATVACALADKHGLEMPVTQTVRNVIEGNLDIDAAIEDLLSRPLPEVELSVPARAG